MHSHSSKCAPPGPADCLLPKCNAHPNLKCNTVPTSACAATPPCWCRPAAECQTPERWRWPFRCCRLQMRGDVQSVATGSRVCLSCAPHAAAVAEIALLWRCCRSRWEQQNMRASTAAGPAGCCQPSPKPGEVSNQTHHPPVSILTVMPEAWHCRMAAGTSGRSGSWMPTTASCTVSVEEHCNG